MDTTANLNMHFQTDGADELAKNAQLFKTLGEAVKFFVESSSEFNRLQEKIKSTFKGATEAGEEFAVKLRKLTQAEADNFNTVLKLTDTDDKLTEGWNIMSTTLKSNTDKIKENTQAIKDQEEAKKRLAAVDVTKSLTSSLLSDAGGRTRQELFDLTKELDLPSKTRMNKDELAEMVNTHAIDTSSIAAQLKFRQAQESVTSAIAQSGLGGAEIQSMFERLQSGIVTQADVAQGKLLPALVKLRDSYLGIGKEAEKNTETSRRSAQAEADAFARRQDSLVRNAETVAKAEQRVATDRASQNEKMIASALKYKAVIQETERVSEARRLLGDQESQIRKAFPAPDNATIAQVNRYETNIRTLMAMLEQVKITAQQFQAVLARVQADPKGLGAGLTPDENKVRTSLSKIQSAFDEAGKAGEKQPERILISWQGMLRLVESLIVRHIAHALLNAVQTGIASANKFSVELQRASAITGVGGNDLRGLTETAANKFGLDRIEVLKTFTDEFGNSASAAAMFSQALVLSSASGLQLNKSVELINETLRTFRLSTQDAGHVSSVFFEILTRGGVNRKELENGFSKLSETAHDAGLTLEQSGALFQLLSDRGYKTRDALSTVEAILQKLIKPSKEVQDVFDKLGVTSIQAAVSAGLFDKVLQELSSRFQQGGLREAAKITEDFKALRGAIELLGDPDLVRKFREMESSLQGVGNRVNEVSDAAIQKANVWRLAWEGVSRAGRAIGDAIIRAGDFQQNEGQHTIGGFGVSERGSIFGGPSIELPWDQLIRNIIGLREEDDLAEQSLARLTEAQRRLQQTAAGRQFNPQIEAIRGELQRVAASTAYENDIVNSILNADKKINSALVREFGAFTANIGARTQHVVSQLDHIAQQYEAASKRLEHLSAERDRKMFQRSIETLSPGEQGAAINQHIDELQAKALRLIDTGNLDAARDTLREIIQLSDSEIKKEEAWLKEARKLGVDVSGLSIDTSREDRAYATLEQIERNAMQEQRNQYQTLIGSAEMLVHWEEQRLRIMREQADTMRRMQEVQNWRPPLLIPGAGGQARGGFIEPKYFAEGGPSGTDTIPAWLSPGEYVMDAENTARFFPQLVSMSLGMKPNNPSNNNSVNVGDIHISYQGTDSKETDVRRLGEQLRREIRRGTLRWD